MPCRKSIRVHSTINYPIEELSLGEAPNGSGRSLDLDVYAYGEAEIAYDRDGDWEITGLRINGHRRNYGGSPTWLKDSAELPTWLKDSAELPRDHPLYPVIVAALESVSYQDIGDRVADALASERAVA